MHLAQFAMCGICHIAPSDLSLQAPVAVAEAVVIVVE